MQGGIPVLIFYGSPSTSTTTVDLDSRFDYVITSVWASARPETASGAVEMMDQDGNDLLWIAPSGAGTAGVPPFTWSSYMPLTGITALGLKLFGSAVQLMIGGLLVVPSFADTVPPPT
jgi:hypothetical protein